MLWPRCNTRVTSVATPGSLTALPLILCRVFSRVVDKRFQALTINASTLNIALAAQLQVCSTILPINIVIFKLFGRPFNCFQQHLPSIILSLLLKVARAKKYTNLCLHPLGIHAIVPTAHTAVLMVMERERVSE